MAMATKTLNINFLDLWVFDIRNMSILSTKNLLNADYNEDNLNDVQCLESFQNLLTIKNSMMTSSTLAPIFVAQIWFQMELCFVARDWRPRVYTAAGKRFSFPQTSWCNQMTFTKGISECTKKLSLSFNCRTCNIWKTRAESRN